MCETMGTIAASVQPTSTPSPTSTLTPTYVPTFTPVPTATSTPTLEIIEPRDHYWLARPFSMEDNNEPTRFYPYGSTSQGKSRIHHGADFPNPFGAPVYAVANGRVIVAGSDDRIVYGERVGFYGQLVIVQLDQQYHGQKVCVLYGHLSQVHVSFLQEVEEGDLIGEVGMTGVAVGPHLHLEVRVGENSYQHTRNPELWLRPLPGKGTIAGRLLDSQGRLVPEQSITFYRKESPDRRWQDVTTYPSHGVNADDDWAENFVLGDVPVGEYLAKTYVNSHLYTTDVTVDEAETSFLTIEVQ
jgi:murein DD-endopeptidase MepM/ murein hydrolase activator NlpD